MRALSLHLLGPFLQACRAASFSPHDDQHVLSQHGPDPVPDLISFQSNLQARGFAALGDSYSAGIGTGTDPDLLPSEGECRRGQHGYPLLLHADLNNRTGTNTTLQWLSCTGAATTDLLSGGPSGTSTTTKARPPSQLDALDTTLPLDFATLSVGGNDLGFFDVMNACIFRFYGWHSGTCAAALAAADAALQPGAALDRRLALLLVEVLDRVRWERRPGFTLTVTGYARFFDDTTPDCDHMSLAVWTGGGVGGAGLLGGPRLSRDLRARLNALVLAANARLAAAVRAANARFRDDDDDDDGGKDRRHPRVLFVDYDDAFRGHRFCEPGVVEPAYDRDDTWFFLVGGPDNDATTTAAPNETSFSSSSSSSSPPPSALGSDDDIDDQHQQQQQHPLPRTADHHPLVEPEACLEPARRRGDWGELALCHMATARARDPSLRPAYRGAVAENSMWGVPTYYGKTFHPRSRGCEAIRDSIYETWARYGLL